MNKLVLISIKVIPFSIRKSFPQSSAYQALQEASRPGDYDEDLPHQLYDDSYLLAFRSLISLENQMGAGDNEMWSSFIQYLCDAG